MRRPAHFHVQEGSLNPDRISGPVLHPPHSYVGSDIVSYHYVNCILPDASYFPYLVLLLSDGLMPIRFTSNHDKMCHDRLIISPMPMSRPR